MVSGHDSLFYKHDEHPDWQRVRDNYHVMKLADDEVIARSYLNFIENVQTGIAGLSKASTHKEGYWQGMMAVTYLSIYSLIGPLRSVQSQFFASNPDVTTSAQIWNMLDDYFIRALFD